ncbi:MAG: SDR family NAD(P)-dependent oxidoreductase [Rikenellaceae bacterium]|nr:SDR family NAD(P)-dependent oxidoreductase [Rikenellaceae bacterium]
MDTVSELNHKTVAVTGGTGMLGRELVSQLLTLGVNPVLIVRNPESMKKLYSYLGAEPELKIIKADFMNPHELTEAFQGTDMIFHCAAGVSMNDGTDNLIALNTDITHHVVNSCMDAGVDKLIHVSSVAALGSEPEKITDENSYPDNISNWAPYAISKFYSENEVWRGHNSGLKTVIVNPSVILGPGNWKEYGTPLMFATIAKGVAVYPPGGSGFVDVRDVASVMIRLSEIPEAVGRRFIVSSENISFRELMIMITNAVGKKPPRMKIGKKTLNFFSKAAEIISGLGHMDNPFSQNIAEIAACRTYYDNSAITRLTGYKFRPVKESIGYMADSYLKDTRK